MKHFPHPHLCGACTKGPTKDQDCEDLPFHEMRRHRCDGQTASVICTEFTQNPVHSEQMRDFYSREKLCGGRPALIRPAPRP